MGDSKTWSYPRINFRASAFRIVYKWPTSNNENFFRAHLYTDDISVTISRKKFDYFSKM